jgi:hypothetical protein
MYFVKDFIYWHMNAREDPQALPVEAFAHEKEILEWQQQRKIVIR